MHNEVTCSTLKHNPSVTGQDDMATILIIDKSVVNRELLMTVLTCGDHTVLQAENVATAEEIIDQKHPDLILTDVMDPLISGYDLAKKLRAMPQFSTMPIIFYAPLYVINETRALAKTCGVQYVLPRPSAPEEILSTVNQALGIKKLHLPVQIISHPSSLPSEQLELNQIIHQIGNYLTNIEATKQEMNQYFSSSNDLSPERLRLMNILKHIDHDLHEIRMLSELLMSLNVLAATLVAEHDVVQFMQLFCVRVREIFGVNYTAVGILGEKKDKLEHYFFSGDDVSSNEEMIAPPLNSKLVNAILNSQDVIIIDNINTKKRINFLNIKKPTKHLIALPLITKTEVLGFVCLIDKKNQLPFSEIDLDLARVIASMFLIIYENLQLYRLSQHQIGELTSLIHERELAEKELIQLRLQAHLNDKLRSIGLLAAGVAHDVNNPISWILLNLEYLQQHGAAMDHAELKNLLTESIHGAERIKDIVSNLKGISRFTEQEIKPVNLHQIIDTVLMVLGHETRLRAVIEKKYAAHLPTIVANESKWYQVFMNLIMNALQAIPEGDLLHHKISIKTRVDKKEIRIDITDTGKGIDPIHLPRIFEPFFTTKSMGEGTGLGLSISQEIVHAYGGRIAVKSQLGKGSTFSVLIPLKAHERTALFEPSLATKTTISSRKNILIVDDEPYLLKALQRMLTPYHDSVTAVSVGDALEKLKTNPKQFDIILADVLMPGMSGADLYETIAKTYPQLVPRILFMTGGVYTSKEKAFIQRVPNECLSKPIDKEALLAQINKVCNENSRDNQ